MNKHYKKNERELIKVVTFFKRQSKKLITEGKLGEEHAKVQEAVDRFVEQMDAHATMRASVMDQRQYLEKLVKDNAVCPKCHTNDKLKLIGSEKNEKGWRSNRYKCRKCNIAFTWNAPNNPWDMISYFEEMLAALKKKNDDPSVNEAERLQMAANAEYLQLNLDKLKPVIEAHDKDYYAIQDRDAEMEKLIHELKNSLLIERIKMDTWENQPKKTG